MASRFTINNRIKDYFCSPNDLVATVDDGSLHADLRKRGNEYLLSIDTIATNCDNLPEFESKTQTYAFRFRKEDVPNLLKKFGEMANRSKEDYLSNEQTPFNWAHVGLLAPFVRRQLNIEEKDEVY